MIKRKLQVFISSTYTDLIKERQAAVEAILESGHIPAGMELFTAGDISQMNVIRQWIDESDIFLLILGGRYGSIEPTTQTSYIQLEYEYALQKAKPFFALVLDASYEEKRVESLGLVAIEREHPEKFRKFRAILTSKSMVRFWTSVLEIKLAIHQSMSEFAKRDELNGWVPADQTVNAARLADEISRLTKENSELRTTISKMKGESSTYSGLTFEDMTEMISHENISDSIDYTKVDKAKWDKVVNNNSRLKLSPNKASLLNFFIFLYDELQHGLSINNENSHLTDSLFKLREYGFVRRNESVSGEYWDLGDDGRRFFVQFKHYLLRELKLDTKQGA